MPVTDNSAGTTGAATGRTRASHRLALLTADNASVPLPASVQAITAILLAVLLIALPWLGLGYRFLSIAITTLYTAIGLYGLGLQFGQAAAKANAGELGERTVLLPGQLLYDGHLFNVQT